jgi:predicted nucleotide-binding protein
MKEKSNKWLKFTVHLVPIAGAVLSVFALIVSIVSILDVSRELMISIFAVMVSFLVGVYSNRLTSAVSKLSRAKRIFLSYSHELEEDVRQISDELREKGAKVWMDQNRIKPGQNLKDEITHAMIDADTVIVFVGKELSPNVMYEIGIAKAKGKKIIPVILRSGELPSDIEELMYIDLRQDKDDGIKKLVDAST